MSRESVLARGRAFFAPGTVDSCIIDRVTAESTNTTTGVVTKTYGLTVYTGPCRMKMGAALATRRIRTVGEAALRIASAELQLPVVGSEGVLADDRVRITASPHDSDLVGQVFFVVGEHHGTWITSRRLAISEVLS
jgi:hypothetical protein